MKRALRVTAAVMLAFAALGAMALAPSPHFETRDWSFDGRFEHDHYYPAPGYRLSALPPGSLLVDFHGQRLFFDAGAWYRRAGAGFVVVRPPLGVVVPVLPPDATAIWIAGAQYYYANDAYYAIAAGGYAVVEPHTP
jgi:hypothetical protein